MKNIIPLLIFFISQQALASWSAYAVITPENKSKYNVNIKASISHSGICTVKLDAVGYPHKHAWLILTSSGLSIKEQNLRYFIWENSAPLSHLVLKSKLNPATNQLKFLKNENINDAYYEINITNQIGHYAYIYIDFPRPVNDGGYYYSIDLGKFCGW